MGPVCVPAKAAFLAAGAGATVTAAALAPDAVVALIVVLSVLSAAGVAWFAFLVRQPVWRPEPRRRRAIPSYPPAAENPPAVISARHVIPGVVIDSQDEVPAPWWLRGGEAAARD